MDAPLTATRYLELFSRYEAIILRDRVTTNSAERPEDQVALQHDILWVYGRPIGLGV